MGKKKLNKFNNIFLRLRQRNDAKLKLCLKLLPEAPKHSEIPTEERAVLFTETAIAKVQTFLQKRGFERLGSGAFSTIYGKPGNDRVIKVLKRPSQDGWIDYIHWANDNGYAGGLAPKVFSYKLLKSGIGLASMERIKCTFYDIENNHEKRVLPTLLHVANDNDTAASLADLVEPGAAAFMKKLKERFDHLDLHSGNYMVRADGSFVMTDPVACSDGTRYTTRLKAA